MPKETSNESLEELYQVLLGSFTSGHQSLFNSKFFDVTMRHCPVNIEGGNANSKYLLLRQAISLSIERPYRVRLVELTLEDGIIKSKNYAPTNSLDLSQTCLPSEVPTLSRELFKNEAKCVLSIFKGQDGDRTLFNGTTGIPGCPSKRNGASFVSSEVEITSTYLKSLDRGWDTEGNQVWGSTSGPYIFQKKPFSKIFPNVTELASMLTGKNSNLDQARGNEDFKFVKSSTCPVRIKGSDVLNSVDLITNQRIQINDQELKRTSLYRFKPQDPNDYLSLPFVEVYPVKDKKLDNHCEQKTTWNTLKDVNISESPCTITFTKRYIYSVPTYFGTTPLEGCPSSYMGAATLKIEEEINYYRSKIWERWYNSEGTQVGGSESGPYVYQRESSFDATYTPILK